MDTVKTIMMFCANDQVDMPHTLDVDGNGEVLLTCECGRCIKYPRGTTATSLKVKIAEHKIENEGQITVTVIEEEKAALLEELSQEFA